jgi:hypothetical protein
MYVYVAFEIWAVFLVWLINIKTFHYRLEQSDVSKNQ